MRNKIALFASAAAIVGLLVSVLPRESVAQRAPAQQASGNRNTEKSNIAESGNAAVVNTSSGVNKASGENSAVIGTNNSGSQNGVANGLSARDSTVIVNTGPNAQITAGEPRKHGPAYGEPTEAEMKAALLREMQLRGGKSTGGDSIAVENAIAGWKVEIVSFDKIDCAAAMPYPGYGCDYQYTVRMSAYSNEGSRAGDNHSNGVNELFKWFNGGDTSSGTAHRRFVKSKSGWVAAPTED